MKVGLGEINDRKIFSVRVSDNLMFETPLLCIGVDDVTEIKYHEPQGDGDKHFIDVSFELFIFKHNKLRCSLHLV